MRIQRPYETSRRTRPVPIVTTAHSPKATRPCSAPWRYRHFSEAASTENDHLPWTLYGVLLGSLLGAALSIGSLSFEHGVARGMALEGLIGLGVGIVIRVQDLF